MDWRWIAGGEHFTGVCTPLILSAYFSKLPDTGHHFRTNIFWLQKIQADLGVVVKNNEQFCFILY